MKRFASVPVAACLSTALLLASASFAFAQAPTAPANTPQSGAKPATTHAPHTKNLHAKKVAEAPPPEPVRPPDPPPPDWPANAKATAASVDWSGRLLTINAANSSLEQILHDVSTAT